MGSALSLGDWDCTDVSKGFEYRVSDMPTMIIGARAAAGCPDAHSGTKKKKKTDKYGHTVVKPGNTTNTAIKQLSEFNTFNAKQKT